MGRFVFIDRKLEIVLFFFLISIWVCADVRTEKRKKVSYKHPEKNVLTEKKEKTQQVPNQKLSKPSTPKDLEKEKAQKLLEALSKKKKIKEEENKVISNYYLEAGKRLFEDFHYEEAKEKFLKALIYNPDNREAKIYLQKTRALLGERIDRVKTAAEWLAQEKAVKIQQTKIELENDLRKVENLVDKSQYKEAKLILDKVGEKIKWMPYDVDLSDIKKRYDILEKKVKEGYKIQIEKERKAKEQQAELLAKEKIEEEKELRERRINKLIERVKDYIQTKRYEKAKELCKRILEIAPENDEVVRLLKLSTDLAYNQKREEIERITEEQRKLNIEQVKESAIPWSKTIVYPEDWDIISQRQPEILQQETDEPWKREIYKVMERQISVDFDSTPLQQVVDFLRDASGVNIILDVNALIDETGEQKEIPITLKMKGPFKSVLEWVLMQANLHYVLKNRAIFISTQEKIQGGPVLKIYDVRDLTTTLTDFPGPDISLETEEEEAASISFEEQGSEEEGLTEETLVDMIKENVAPQTWENEGVSIAMRAGKLVVSQTEDVHKQIEQLLNAFRRTKSIQVSIETRFIEVQDDFFEELGMQWGEHGTTWGIDTHAGYADMDKNEEVSITDVNTTGITPQKNRLTYQGANNEGLSFYYGFLNYPQVRFILQAIQKDRVGTILSAPRITLSNTQRGHIMIANQQSYIYDYDVSDESYDPQIRTFQEGIIFDVKPTVSADKKYITMELRPGTATLQRIDTQIIQTFITVGTGDNETMIPMNLPIQLPLLSLKKVRCTVTLPDGGTLLIGGLKDSMHVKGKSGVPILSNIPFIGRLFSVKTESNENSNLIILVTARMILFEEEEKKL